MLHCTGDKAYAQAPHEEVTTAQDESRWNEIVANFTPVDFTGMHEKEDVTTLQNEVACAGGACEVL